MEIENKASIARTNDGERSLCVRKTQPYCARQAQREKEIFRKKKRDRILGI